MARIHCLGAIVVDALSGPLASYPVPKTQTLAVTESLTFLPGGGAANTSAALARMGESTAIFSKLGCDVNGVFARRTLEDAGVHTGYITQVASESTPFTFVGIHTDGDRTFIHTPGTNLTMSREELNLDHLFDAEFLLYQDCWALPRLDGLPGASVLKEAQQRGVTTLLEECWGLGPCRERWEAMVPFADYVLPSIDDMRAIYPGNNPEEITARLLALGCGTAVIKMGVEGCLIASQSGIDRVGSIKANVVDTTGAGDCWDAGFIAGLVHGLPVREAARLGAACAAFCVEHIGGSTGVPSYAHVLERASLSQPA